MTVVHTHTHRVNKQTIKVIGTIRDKNTIRFSRLGNRYTQGQRTQSGITETVRCNRYGHAKQVQS